MWVSSSEWNRVVQLAKDAENGKRVAKNDYDRVERLHSTARTLLTNLAVLYPEILTPEPRAFAGILPNWITETFRFTDIAAAAAQVRAVEQEERAIQLIAEFRGTTSAGLRPEEGAS